MYRDCKSSSLQSVFNISKLKTLNPFESTVHKKLKFFECCSSPHTVDDTLSNESHRAAISFSIFCKIKFGIILLLLNEGFGKDGKQQQRLLGILQKHF